MEIGLTGLNEVTIPGARTKDNERGYDDDAIRAALGRPTPDRLLLIAQAIRLGVPLEDIQRSTAFDPWYLQQIAALVATETRDRAKGMPGDHDGQIQLKKMGRSEEHTSELQSLKRHSYAD